MFSFQALFLSKEMNEPYSILFQKMKSDAPVKDLLDNFGMVCTDFPLPSPGDVKDLPKRDWADEDGEDIFVPDTLPIKAYDIKISVCYEGTKGTAMDKLEMLLDYLTGADNYGSRLKIYNAKTHTGRQDVYLTKISDTELWQGDDSEILEFNMELHVCDPKTRIIPSYKAGSSTVVENLVVRS